jgi:hypothetical protein
MSFVVLVWFALIFVACSKAENGAVTAVERYYLAIVQQNQSDLSNVVCPAFEEQASLELNSFRGVKIELVDFECAASEPQENETLVTCSGKIAASYGNDKMDFPLEERVHHVTNASGDWLVCGY